MNNFSVRYANFFSLDEIRDNMILHWATGALVFAYFIAFASWVSRFSLSVQAYEGIEFLCPVYYQNCDMWYFLQPLPYGYSQSMVFMVLFATLVAAVYYMYEQDWVMVQVSLLPSFFFHFISVFVASYYFTGNYEYYIVVFALALLFLPHKEFFLKLFLVLFYMLSTMVKIHPGWVHGTYFSSLTIGLPLFPDWSIPLWTNAVIVAEMVGAWFLFSRTWLVQRTAILFFTLFHLYSGLIVLYRYPATVLPMLLIMFGPWYRHTDVPLDRKSLWGWGVVLFLCIAQLSSHLIPGDEKLTMEGNKFGLYMFEANHQCSSRAKIYLKDGSIENRNRDSIVARNRCEVYSTWFQLQEYCDRFSSEVDRIEWTFDHSINGGPFLRIVDETNVCDLDFKAFSHNEWIKTEQDNPEVIGYPVENVYY